MKGQELAKQTDLEFHLKTDWHVVHGLWDQIRAFLDRKVSAKQKSPATDIGSSLTCDDAWHDFDFTSLTSSTATWAILSIYFWKNDFTDPVMFGPPGTTADTNATIWIPILYYGDENYYGGGFILLPLTGQKAAYHIPVVGKKIILLGYI
jgi:hypothetical protein